MTEEESHDQTQPTEQPQPEQPQSEQLEQPEQTTEQTAEQQPTEQSNEQNDVYIDDTLTSMKLRTQPPHRRYTSLIAELQDPNLYDIEKGVKINPIQLRKGPRNRMPHQAVEFQDKALFNAETQIRKNPLELRKTPRGRRYSHVVSAMIEGDPLIDNNELPSNLQYNNEAEDILGSSPLAKLEKLPEGKNKENGEESQPESATSSSSDYQNTMPKSISSLHDYNELGDGSNSDNGEQKEQKKNPLSTRTGPKRRVSSEVAPLIDQSKNEVKERSINLDDIGEVVEKSINLDEFTEGHELEEQPTDLDINNPDNYANIQPWVILPRPDVAERTVTIEEPYETIGADGRNYADNAPWVVQDEEQLNNPSTDNQGTLDEQQSPEVRERGTSNNGGLPAGNEENYEVTDEAGRNLADNAPWVVQDEEQLNNTQGSNENQEAQGTPVTLEENAEQNRETNINQAQPETTEENYEVIDEAGRNLADGAPWVVQDESTLNNQEQTPATLEEQGAPVTLEEQGAPATLEENAEQNRETNINQAQPETTEENYEVVDEAGRNLADGAPWVVQDESTLNNQEQTPATLEEQGAPVTLEEQGAPATLEEQGAPVTLEEQEGNYEVTDEAGRNLADNAPWVVQDESTLNNQEQAPATKEEQSTPVTLEEQGAPATLEEQGAPVTLEEQEGNYEVTDEAGRNLADNAPWVVQDENSLNTPAEDQEAANAQEEQERKTELEEAQPEGNEENYEVIDENGHNLADNAPWVVQDESNLDNQGEEQKQEEQGAPVTLEEKDENYEVTDEAGRNLADNAPWVVQDENNLNNQEEEQGQESPEAKEREAGKQQEENEENYEVTDDAGRNLADNAPWVVQDEDNLNNQEAKEGEENLEANAEEEKPEAGEENYEVTDEAGRNLADNAPWVVQDENNLNNQEEEEQGEAPAENQPEQEGQEAQEGEENYEVTDEAGRNLADNAPWVVQDENKLNNQEEEEGQEAPAENQPEQEGQENQEGEENLEANAEEEQPEAGEENYEVTDEAGRNLADNAPWVVQDEDNLNKKEEEEQGENQVEEGKPSEPPTTTPEKGPQPWVVEDESISASPAKPRKLKKNKRAKKVNVSVQTIKSALTDEPQDQEEKPKNNNKASSTAKRSTSSKKSSSSAAPKTTTRSIDANENEPEQQQKATKEPKKTTTTTAQKKQQQQQQQPKQNTKKEPATKKQQQQKQATEPTTTTKKAASKTSSTSGTTKKQPASTTSSSTAKKTNEKVIYGKPALKEGKLDKNNRKNYADNQPWVVHEEEQEEKKNPTTTSRSAKPSTSTSTKQKQPSTKTTSTSSKKEEPKKSTTSKKQQPTSSKGTTSSTTSKSKPSTTSSSKTGSKKEEPKKTTTTKKSSPTSKKSTNEVKSGQPSKTRSAPLDKDDENNYADNQPWVVHDDDKNASSTNKSTTKSSKPTKKSTTTASSSSKPTKTSSSANTDKKQSSTTKKESEKKQPTTANKKKQPSSSTTTTSRSAKPQTKSQKNTQKRERSPSKNDSLDDLPAKVRNSPIGKKIIKVEKETSETWRDQGLLYATISGFPQIKQDEELYGDEQMRKYIQKELEERRDTDDNNNNTEYEFKVCVVGPPQGGKSTFLTLFTDELLKDMITNDAWKTTFVFILDFSSLIPFLNDTSLLYGNMIQTTINYVCWSRSPLIKYKKNLENYFSSIIKRSTPPKKDFLADCKLSEEETEKVDELIDRSAVQSIGEEIHQIWSDQSNLNEVYKLIFELPKKLSEACRFEKSIYILDHVDDCINAQVKPNTEQESEEEEVSLDEIVSELLDDSNCIVSCHDSNHFAEIKKDLDRFDISTIVDKNKKNYTFDVQIKEQPKKNLSLTADHCQGAPALLGTWDKMVKTADLLNKARNSTEKQELNENLKELTQNLVNAVFAGEISTSGEDRTVENVKLLDKKKTTK